MSEPESVAARTAILNSIREHLFASSTYDTVYNETKDSAHRPEIHRTPLSQWQGSLVDLFKKNLESVNGRCFIANDEASVLQALREIIAGLSDLRSSGLRVAISDAPFLAPLVNQLSSEVNQITLTPAASDLFEFDIGVTTAQAAIAETGTLILQSDRERHRLISLIPPVHIAIIEARRVCLTLGEALASLREDKELSPAITFITGPSRTADIELTLAIGVHGPKQLFVIISNETQAQVGK